MKTIVIKTSEIEIEAIKKAKKMMSPFGVINIKPKKYHKKLNLKTKKVKLERTVIFKASAKKIAEIKAMVKRNKEQRSIMRPYWEKTF